jgi:hypothetical protein
VAEPDVPRDIAEERTASVDTAAVHTPTPTDADPATTDGSARRRRGPDALTLLVGLGTLVMAVFAFVGELPDLGFVDPRWLLAGGAAVVGLFLLVGSLRGRSGGRRGGS